MNKESASRPKVAGFVAAAITLTAFTTLSPTGLAQNPNSCVLPTECSTKANGTSCSDGTWATTGDTCQGGFCQGTLLPRLVDGAPALSDWPNSDQRIDFMLAYAASRGSGSYSYASDGVPMVGGYAVSNLWTTPQSPLDLGFHAVINDRFLPLAGPNCPSPSASSGMGVDFKFVTSFDPGFFERFDVNAVRHYELFLQKFRKENPKTLWGGYVSLTTCIDHPTAWDNTTAGGNDTPPSGVDCCLLSPICSHGAGVDRYPACGARWYVNVHDPFIASSFEYRIGQAVSHFYPLPDFVFLDNAEYDFPSEEQCVPFESGKDPFHSPGTQTLQCIQGNNRDYGTDHRSYFVYREGSSVNFSDVINHTSSTLRLLNELNIRGMINLNFEPWWLQTYYESLQPDATNPYPTQFLHALVQQHVNQTPTDPGQTVVNGISVENAFRVPYRFSPARSFFEVQQYREWLQSGIVIAFNAYDKPGRWDAAMAMMMREPTQSVFVERDDKNALDDPSRYFVAVDAHGAPVNSVPWPKWPSFYGSSGPAVWKTRWAPDGTTPDYFESFYIKRQYGGNILYTVHALADRSTQDKGCATKGSVNLATLLQTDIPSATFQQLKLGNPPVGDPPNNPPKGTFDGVCYVVTGSTIDNDTDFFTLASPDCAHNPPGACAIDVEVAIGIVNTNLHPDPNGP